MTVDLYNRNPHTWKDGVFIVKRATRNSCYSVLVSEEMFMFFGLTQNAVWRQDFLP